MLKNKISSISFVFLVSFINLSLYHIPFFSFTFSSLNESGSGNFITAISIILLILFVNMFVFYLLLTVSNILTKILLFIFFSLNSIAIFFINTYGVIIDISMIGNILNTNYDEASSFFSFKLLLYFIVLGLVPFFVIIKLNIVKDSFKKQVVKLPLFLTLIFSIVFINSKDWLWVDKHSTRLGALVMPWSYVVNTSRFYLHESKKTKKQILLPNAFMKDTVKSIFVLVIGESARSENFSLLGYQKNTNPLLSQIENIHCFEALSCATYTTAGIKCMLEHKNTNKLYETLPNYLYRNNVDVFWRSVNWGEPQLNFKNRLYKNDLKKLCNNSQCNYDEILLSGLRNQILNSKKNKIFIALHTSTSHGPSYYKKYPAEFEVFKPVCKSVDLNNCSSNELINAYNNTIVYTDYILYRLINELKKLPDYRSTMFFVSDHGESLGENNLYLHGIPSSFAPKEQLEIPFIIWTSDYSNIIKPNVSLSQHHVFHSVLSFLAIDSPIYNESMSVFK